MLAPVLPHLLLDVALREMMRKMAMRYQPRLDAATLDARIGVNARAMLAPVLLVVAKEQLVA
jgi:hypothetical protein